MSRQEMVRRGWDALDVLLVTGDAHVDHPAFGAALLGRWLEAHGLRVGVVAQPRWDRPDDVARLGRPRLLAGVTAGALDSMLAHYTAFRRPRRDDAYTPGGRAGARPNRASIVYANLVRQAFPGLPVVLGGVEASLRRVAHYDFWSDRLRRSILLDSKADLLLYGMAERSLLALARYLGQRDAAAPRLPADLPGSVRACGAEELPALDRLVRLPSFEAIQAEPRLLVEATVALERQVHHGDHPVVQAHGARQVLVTPPAAPPSTAELDALYALPFSRRPHPRYTEAIPAADMIQFSITSHRGCPGGCAFCSLALHQGRRVSSRSPASLAAEVAALAEHPDWRGALTDVGGPSANLWGATCERAEGTCRRASCLHPRRCRHLRDAQAALAGLLRELEQLPGVRHLRVASGVRHDVALDDEAYLEELVTALTGGQLKLAPEHVRPGVLRLMRKPPRSRFEAFLDRFEALSRQVGKEQYVVPYLMSAHPGCTDQDMQALRGWLARRGWRPRQVQCFVPTPGTLATAMFYAGVDAAGRPVPVARTDAARRRQHTLLTGEEAPRDRRARSGPGPGRSRRDGGRARPRRGRRSR